MEIRIWAAVAALVLAGVGGAEQVIGEDHKVKGPNDWSLGNV